VLNPDAVLRGSILGQANGKKGKEASAYKLFYRRFRRAFIANAACLKLNVFPLKTFAEAILLFFCLLKRASKFQRGIIVNVDAGHATVVYSF